MKELFILTLLWPGFLFGQFSLKYDNYFDYVKAHKLEYISKGALTFGYGFDDGLESVLLHHYSGFEKVFPEANPYWWNPTLSWKNKYRDYDNGDKRAAFPGSKTWAVWATDGYHAVRAAKKVKLIFAITINIGERRPAAYYFYDAIFYSTCATAGFHTSWSIIFKK